jgi:hypothetical protein
MTASKLENVTRETGAFDKISEAFWWLSVL